MKSTISKLGLAAIALVASACYGGRETDEGSAPESTAPESVGDAPAAIERFAMACIKNTTGQSINYQVKWGNGPWTEFSVGGESGANRWHSWRYTTAGASQSPELRIRFDSDMSDGTSWVEYKLTKYAAAEESCNLGRVYQFEWDGSSRRYIDLKAVD